MIWFFVLLHLGITWLSTEYPESEVHWWTFFSWSMIAFAHVIYLCEWNEAKGYKEPQRQVVRRLIADYAVCNVLVWTYVWLLVP